MKAETQKIINMIIDAYRRGARNKQNNYNNNTSGESWSSSFSYSLNIIIFRFFQNNFLFAFSLACPEVAGFFWNSILMKWFHSGNLFGPFFWSSLLQCLFPKMVSTRHFSNL